MFFGIQVVDYMVGEGTNSTQDWAWQKQLRYYITTDQKASMSMCDASFNYTFEYQGNAPKLVHTPLTDKCYLTLTQVRVYAVNVRYMLYLFSCLFLLLMHQLTSRVSRLLSLETFFLLKLKLFHPTAYSHLP